jgi:two-component system chemotaxis response regulator CheY
VTETSKIETSCASKSVLIVDDNAALRGLLRVSLHAFGVAKVYEAESVDLALSLVACKHIDLIITDWKMRPRDGLELVRQVRNPQTCSSAYVPIIMLTAYSDGEHIRAATQAGASAFLVKPFNSSSLATTIVEALEDDRTIYNTSDYLGPDRRAVERTSQSTEQSLLAAR